MRPTFRGLDPLEFVYLKVSEPITALIVSLLLVPFVMSDYVTIIVTVSVLAAWLLFILRIARGERIKLVPVVARLLILLVIGFPSWKLAQCYIGWSLTNYDAETNGAPIAPPRRIPAPSVWKTVHDHLVRPTPTVVALPPAPVTTEKSNEYESLSDAELKADCTALVGEIQDFEQSWKAQIDNAKDFFNNAVYNQSPRPSEEEMARLDDVFEKKKVSIRDQLSSDGKKLFIRANNIHIVLLKRLQAQRVQVPPDKGIEHDFTQLTTVGPNDPYEDDSPRKVVDYLIQLNSRLHAYSPY